MGLKRYPPLITQEAIAKRVKEMGAEITHDYQSRAPICVGILKGSIVFFSDLIRAIDLPIEIDLLGASSYGQKTVSSGVVQITHDLALPVTDRDVLVVEDIVDTGNTLHYLLENLRLKKPASLKLCALLHKPDAAQRKHKIDYLGFSIPNRYVIGYGLDAAEKLRNLPYIAVLPQEDIP
jgi:hypoxanthine phosphoribosyltransferase